MDERILKTILLLFLLDVYPLLVSGGRFCNNPSPPVCADDCNGNGYYINEEETSCIQCQTCTPGQELNKVCGNGLNGNAVCIPCREGYYSSSTSKYCTPCTACINAVEEEPCQLTQDRVCGDCLPGFVRRSGRFPTDPNACPDRCSDLSRDAPQCSEWWSYQQGELMELDEEQPEETAPLEMPVEVVPLDGLDQCEPVPPRCIDRCYDGHYFLDIDGLCKACLQCQPGEELNKVCGRGKNGDAYCQRCTEGTCSEHGLGRCTPCRICVNTVATECTTIRDSQCGECLPGYYQDADEFFPDRGACPNRCMECPSTIPQCQEWCESTKNSDTVTMDAVESIDGEVDSPFGVEAEIFPSDTDKEEINVEADSAPANHASYTIIFTVLASLLAVVIFLVVILFVFHYSWKRSGRSNASITGETTLLPGPSATSSPRSSPGSTPPTVYRPTTYSIPSEEEAWEFMNLLRKYPSAMSAAFSSITGSRPVSGSLTDSENRSSAASTPTMNLNRRLENRQPMRHTMERQFGVDHDDSSASKLQHQLRHPGGVKEEHAMVNPACSRNRAGLSHVNEKHPTQFDRDKIPDEKLSYSEDLSVPRVSSFSKVVTEKESGTVHQHLEHEDEAPGRLVRRRNAIVSNSINEDQLWLLRNGSRRNSVPGLQVGSGIPLIKKSLKGSNGNTTHVPELEAALDPPDSTRDDGSITNVHTETNNNYSDPKLRGQSLDPTATPRTPPDDAADTKSRVAKGTFAILAEKPPTQTNPEKKPIPSDVGNKSYGETKVTINITTKAIETLHVGEVHNRHPFAHQSIMESGVHDDDDDEDETNNLLNVNMATTETDTIPVDAERSKDTPSHGDGDDMVEGDKLLDTKSSERF